MSDGVLTAVAGDVTYAWCGVDVTSATDLTETTEYNALSEAERYAKALDADMGYLTGILAGPGCAVELRWLHDPRQLTLRLAVLARTVGPDPASATAAAIAIRDRLEHTPGHVVSAPITDAADLHGVLVPFAPHARGLAGVAKRCVMAEPQRSDSRWASYFAVQPLTLQAGSWQPLLEGLRQRTERTLLSVGLEPWPLGSGHIAALTEMATEYARLGEPFQFQQGGLNPRVVAFVADGFASEAGSIFEDVARRYRGPTYRFRITISSEGPVDDDGFAQLVAATISPSADTDGRGDSYLDRARTGVHAQVQRPRPHEVAVVTHNLATLSFGRWGGDPLVWEGPQAPASWLRDVTEVVDITEACAAFRLPAAVTGGLPGFSVTAPGVSGFSDYRPEGPALTLGDRLVGRRTHGQVLMARADLPKHAFICGTTGQGKTNTVLNLTRQLWLDHRVPFLVIEPVNSDRDDYRRLVEDGGMEDLIVLTAADERAVPFRLNPFEVPAGLMPRTHIATLLSAFDAAFGLWDPLPIVYRRALTELYRNAGFILDEVVEDRPAGGWPTLGAFVRAIGEAVETFDFQGDIGANIRASSVGRAESLVEGAPALVLDCDNGYPIAELLARPTVLELARLSENPKEQALVMALVLSAMTSHYKASFLEGGLRHVTVIEEAHRLLQATSTSGGDHREGDARERAAEMFANSLAENRKYGEALVIVEQVPAKLVADAVKNTNLKVMHRLPGEDDRQLVGETMRFTPDQERHASNLRPGQAYASHDALDRAALMVVAPYDGPPLPPTAAIRRRADDVRRTTPSVASAVAPYTECSGCPAPCAYRSRAISVAGPRHVAETKAAIGAREGMDADARGAWWDGMVRAVEAMQPLGPGAGGAERAGELACRFVHLMRRAYPTPQPDWIERFRTEVERVPPSAPATADGPGAP